MRDDKHCWWVTVPTRICRPRMGDGLRGRKRFSLRCYAWVWPSYIPDMAFTEEKKRGKNDYGFLHTLPSTALLLMWGDFIHAGGVSWQPRCHMKFYPRLTAGLVREHALHYWLQPSFQCDIDEEKTEGSQEERSFLWQHYAFPFAFPTLFNIYATKFKRSRRTCAIHSYYNAWITRH